MKSLADLYQSYIVDLDPILFEMGRINGIHVNNEARLQLLGEMDTRIAGKVKEAQSLIPPELFPLKHYKTPPETEREVRTVAMQNPEVKTCSRCGTQHVTQASHTARKGGKGDTPLNPCYKAPLILSPGVDTEYDVVLDFNPGSDDQLKGYADLYHHKLGRNWRTGEATLDAKQLQKFIDKYGINHPIYANASEVRKVRKAAGYARAWVPDEKGLIYGHFKHVPETLRLSQSDHNLMNVSHRGNVPYAEELRQLLIAPPGYMLVEGDSASIEAVMSGYFMGSPEYMALARKGIHAWWCLKKLRMDITPENLKWVKGAKEHQVLYDTKKRTVHAVSYGMGAKLLHESYPEYFPRSQVVDKRTGKLVWSNTATAQAEIDEFYSLVPTLKQWHDDTQKMAHKQGYLENPYGLRNYYYRVFSFDWKTKKWRIGEDAKATIAFLPQSSNAFFQRGNLKLIHEAIVKLGKAGKWWQPAIGHIHDSAMIVVPEDEVYKAKDVLIEVMSRPIKEMGNLLIGVQVKAGKNWNEMAAI